MSRDQPNIFFLYKKASHHSPFPLIYSLPQCKELLFQEQCETLTVGSLISTFPNSPQEHTSHVQGIVTLNVKMQCSTSLPMFPIKEAEEKGPLRSSEQQEPRLSRRKAQATYLYAYQWPSYPTTTLSETIICMNPAMKSILSKTLVYNP